MSDGTKITGDHIAPEELYIHGLDPLPPGYSAELAETRFGHLADPVHVGLALPDLLTKQIEKYGVRKPVHVQSFRMKVDGKDTRVKVVIDGRTRVRVARELNRKLSKVGARDEAFFRVPYILEEADDLAPVLLNCPGRVDGPIATAKVAASLKARGRTEAEILSVLSGEGKPLTKATLANYRSLLTLPREIQDSIESGETPVSGGYALARLEGHAAQLEAWKRAAPEGDEEGDEEDDEEGDEAPSKPPRKRKAKDVTAAASDRIVPPTARQVAMVAERLKPGELDDAEPDDVYTIVVQALEWACGKATGKVADEMLRKAISAATKPRTPKETKSGLPRKGKVAV